MTCLELSYAAWAVWPDTGRQWHCFCYLTELFLSNPWRSLRTFKHCCANTWWVRICGWHFSLWNILVNKHLQKQRKYFELYWYWKEKRKSGVFPLLFATAVVPSISLSSGLLLLNLPKLSNQYEWPSELQSESNLLFSGQDFSSFRKETGFTGKRKGWLNGSRKAERSLPTTNKQIKTAAMQRIPVRAVSCISEMFR